MALDYPFKYEDRDPVYQDPRVTIYSDLSLRIFQLSQEETEIKHLPAHARATHEFRLRSTSQPKKTKVAGVVYQDKKGDFWLLKTKGGKTIYCDYITGQTLIELEKDGCLISAYWRENNY